MSSSGVYKAVEILIEKISIEYNHKIHSMQTIADINKLPSTNKSKQKTNKSTLHNYIELITQQYRARSFGNFVSNKVTAALPVSQYVDREYK